MCSMNSARPSQRRWPSKSELPTRLPPKRKSSLSRCKRICKPRAASPKNAVRAAPQRRALTYLDSRGERTITVLGEKLHPLGADPLAWEELDATDGVYFTAGDEAALGQARRAGVLVATARELKTLRSAGVQLDALVHSARDPAERYEPGQLDPAPRLVVSTEGSDGGRFVADGEEGRWAPAP